MSTENYDAQERTVTALWNFARALRAQGLSPQMSEVDFTETLTRAADRRTGPSPVGAALDDIMGAFGFRVTAVD